jgi:hypothetical protein
MYADAAIPDPYPPGCNLHAHIMLTMRPLDEKGYERISKYPKSTKYGRQNPIAGRWK